MKGMIKMTTTMTKTPNYKDAKKYTPVFKLHLAGLLMTQGFVLIYCKQHEYVNGRIVYYFMSSLSLDNAIKQYSNNGYRL